jgi:hypothetical protein
VVNALWLAAIAAGEERLAARARSGTKARNLLIKTTEQREHSSSARDFSPKETLTGILLDVSELQQILGSEAGAFNSEK